MQVSPGGARFLSVCAACWSGLPVLSLVLLLSLLCLLPLVLLLPLLLLLLLLPLLSTSVVVKR